MSIVVIRGPAKTPCGASGSLTPSLHPAVIASLVDSATSAGKSLSIRSCACVSELVDAIALLDRERPEVVLVEPGAGLDDARVHAALRALHVPFVEIHGDPPDAREAELHDPPPNRLGVVHGFMAQGFTLGMAWALDHLGCADCGSRYHVGT